MKREIYTLFVLLFVGSTLSAQQRYLGRVVSEKDASPIELANVVVLRSGELLGGAVTDSLGRYQIALEEGTVPEEVRVSAIGYQTALFPIQSGEQQLKLKEDTEALGEVVVLGRRKGISLSGDKLKVQVALNPALKNSGSLDDLLNKIPFLSAKGGSYQVLGSTGSVEIYLNGQRVQDPSILLGYRSQDIKSVEVINTPGASYRSTVGSVIKIETNRRQGQLSLSVDQYLLQQRHLSSYTGIRLAMNGEKTMLSLNLGYSHTHMKSYARDLYQIAKPSSALIETEDKAEIDILNRAVLGGLSLNVSPKKEVNYGFTTNLKAFKPDIDISSEGLKHRVGGVELFNSPTSSALNNQSLRSTSSFYYNHQLGATRLNITDELLLGYGKKQFRYSEEGSQLSTALSSRQRYWMNALILTVETSLMETLDLSLGGEVSYSYNSSRQEKKEQGIQTGLQDAEVTNKQTLWALFSELSWQLKPFRLTAGLRYEYERSSYREAQGAAQYGKPHSLTPSLSLSYRSGGLSASLSYRQTLSRPAYASLNEMIAMKNRYIYTMGSAILLPRKTHNLKLLLSYKDFSLSASYNEQTNLRSSVLSSYPMDEEIILERVVLFPRLGLFSLGLDWRSQYGTYYPTLSLSLEKQYLNYQGMSYGKPSWRFSTDHYFDLSKGWSVDLNGGYSSKRYSMLREIEGNWYYQLSLSKTWGALSVDLTFSNLFLDRYASSLIRVGHLSLLEEAREDNRGVSLNLSYRFGKSQRTYRNDASSGERSRF